MTPSRIFKRAEASWTVFKVVLYLFWLPLIAMLIASFIIQW